MSSADGIYEVGTAMSVRAFHVMPGMPPPEGVRHSHDYKLEVTVHRDGLDDRGMVVDLDALEAALRAAVAPIDGANLEIILPPGSAAVTVEVFARWLHGQLGAAIGPLPAAELAVRVWESDLAYGGYRHPLDGSNSE